MKQRKETLTVVMMGATGAVGGHVVKTLQAVPHLQKLTLLGRRLLPNLPSEVVDQQIVDVLKPEAYRPHVAGHRAAVCTLGVGQPSKMSKADFVKIDKEAVLDFARVCKESGVEHFELLSSVGANSQARSFYLRTKGELCEGLIALDFPRLSLFQPSMILTPTNRYGLAQALTLALWPKLTPLLRGSWARYRGIAVETLGTAMATNLLAPGEGVETLQWKDFVALAAAAPGESESLRSP